MCSIEGLWSEARSPFRHAWGSLHLRRYEELVVGFSTVGSYSSFRLGFLTTEPRGSGSPVFHLRDRCLPQKAQSLG